MGSIFSTSYTKRGHPNLRHVSRVFRKDSSVNEVLVSFLSLRKEVRNASAYPDGSMTRGYLWNLLSMIAFSMHRSSEGRVFDCQISLSLPLDRNSMRDNSYLSYI
jgi:hypothetical protein